MMRGRIIFFAWIAIALNMLILLGSCSRTGESGPHSSVEPKESAMKLDHQTASKPVAIPPIDATVPEAFQTATFGLG